MTKDDYENYDIEFRLERAKALTQLIAKLEDDKVVNAQAKVVQVGIEELTNMLNGKFY